MNATETTNDKPRRRATKRAPAALERPMPRSATFDEVFEQWCELQRDSGNMTQKSLDKYASLWSNWTGWLTRWQIKNLHDVSAAELQRFLDGPAPSLTPKHRPKKTTCMSPNTRARYYHLIDSVFSLCLYPSDAGRNPSRQIEQGSRPKLSVADLKPQLLDPAVFKALRDARQIRMTVAMSPSDDHRWWLLRDRAILAVLAETGLTVSELRALTPRDLGGDGLRLTPGQLLLEGMEAQVRVQLENQYTKVGRNLPLSRGMSRVLLEWLHRRHQLLEEKSKLVGPAAARARYLAEQKDNAPVFFAKPRGNDEVFFKPMRTDSLYYVVNAALVALRERLGAPAARAEGPAVIRNSLIQHWVNQHGPALAAEMAGYADETSVRAKRQTQG